MNPVPHHRRSIRLPGYDYTQPGAYFITLVTCDRAHLFGEVVAGVMKENNLGRLARREWERLALRFAAVEVDAFVVMPNHLHGIIAIRAVGARGELTNGSYFDSPRAPTDSSLFDAPRTPTTEKFGAPVAGSIPTIVRSYKSSVTQLGRIVYGLHAGRIWQRNYYEHVVRNQEELNRIREYILRNPELWENDQGNPRPGFAIRALTRKGFGV